MFSSLPFLTVIVLHLLVAYIYLVVPFLSGRETFRTKRSVTGGDAKARLQLYWGVILGQGVVFLIVLALVIWGKVPPALVGFGRPYSWPLCLAVTACVVGLLLWSGLGLRARAPAIRERLRLRPNVMIPVTDSDRVWFTIMGFVAGLTEEVLCRGFVFFYIQLWFPGLPLWGVVLLSAAGFGIAHLYQGPKGVLSTGIGGIVLGLAYVGSGNLFLPIVLHGFINARISFLPACRSDQLDALPGNISPV